MKNNIEKMGIADLIKLKEIIEKKISSYTAIPGCCIGATKHNEYVRERLIHYNYKLEMINEQIDKIIESI